MTGQAARSAGAEAEPAAPGTWLPWPLAAAVAALIVVPALLAPIPPVVDLPQQLAQIRLFPEAWSSPESPYRIAWTAPNKLSYPLLAVALALGGASWGPRLAMILCGAALAAAILALARRLDRPAEHAALATLLVYSGVYYGGFLSFLVGGAAFAAWLLLLHDVEPRPRHPRLVRQRFVHLLLAALALYYAHLLWIAVAALAVVFPGPRARGARPRVEALAALAPFAVAGLLWYLSTEGGSHPEPPRYDANPLLRLARADEWGRLVFFGLRGRWELGLLGALGIWAALCLARRRPGSEPSGWLGKVALLLLVLGLALPDAAGYTALLAQRWLPWAAICGLLALPAPGFGRRTAGALAIGLLLAHAAVTARAWRGFARDELRGFAPSLATVRSGERLLGLDFVRVSPRFRIAPYAHLAAYAQLDRRVTLGYSFASTPTSLVVYRDRRHENPWTRGLDHLPRLLAPTDLDHFDYLLVHARPETQQRVAGLTGRLRVVAGEPPWLLYAVEAGP